jgi:hypothetical protein
MNMPDARATQERTLLPVACMRLLEQAREVLTAGHTPSLHFLSSASRDPFAFRILETGYFGMRGRATPIRQSRVTQTASSASVIPSVPSGRTGRTM